MSQEDIDGRFNLSRGLDFRIWHAIEEIKLNHGDNVGVGRLHINKFGGADTFGTTEIEISTLVQDENYQNSNTITAVASSDDTDTQTLSVESMILQNGKFVFSLGEVTLTGNTPSLITPSARISRSRNLSGDILGGDVYFFRGLGAQLTGGVPDDVNIAHLKVNIGDEQSLKAANTIEHNSYFLITSVWAYMGKKQTAKADIRLKVRDFGGVFNTRHNSEISNDNALEHPFEFGEIVHPGSDITITAECSTTNVALSAGYTGIYLDIIGYDPDS